MTEMNSSARSRLHYLPALVCAVLLATTNAAPAASAREQRTFDAAANAFRDGFFERAESELGDFAEKYPKSDLRPRAILLQAQSRYKSGNLKGAVELLSSNLGRAGSFTDEYLFWIAEACFQDRNYSAASLNYAKLIALYPDSPRNVESAVGEALARWRLGQSRQVVDLLTKPDGGFARAIPTGRTNEFVVRGLLLLGEAQLALGNLPAAESALTPLAGRKTATALDWRIQQLRCRILLAQGRAEEALEISTNLPVLAAASLESRPQLIAESIVFQAEILEKLNRLDAAISLLQTNLLDGVPAERQREALLRIADLSLALGQVSDARRILNEFLNTHTNSPVADMVYLALGELDLKQHAAGVPMSGTISTNLMATNRLQRATAAFDELINKFPNSLLFGRALLDKGWCLWLDGDVTNSLPLFKSAAERLPFSEEQAVARFKLADAQMASGDFSRALTNYNFVIENYVALSSVRTQLFEPALYLGARAAMRLGNLDAGSDALAKVMEWFPNGFAGDRSLLLIGQGYLERKDVARARELFDEFVKRWPESPLLPQVQLAIARSYEQEGNWLLAISNYDQWITEFTNSTARSQAEFRRAWANFQAGRETNAFVQFTNCVMRFPSNDLAPAAQSWIGDYFFRQADFANAEKNYKLLFQTWPASPLAYEARMMAGRAALARAGYADAISHFTNLTSDLTCPAGLKVQALFAYGDTLIQAASANTNKFANYEEAIRVYAKIHQLNATNAQAALAWGAMGNCYLQLGATNEQFCDAATNAYRQAMNLPAATVSARSHAQIGIGLALESVAALRPEEDRQLLKQALANYLDVVYEKNLRDGETADLFWVKKAGLEAGRLVESLQEWNCAVNLYQRLETLLPSLHESLGKKITRVREQLDSARN